MQIKSLLAQPLANYISSVIKKESKDAVMHQEQIRTMLLQKAKHTYFGKQHKFANIESYTDFKQAIPIRDYEQCKPFIERIKEGESDILWEGKPIYFAKTSGTTSGVKYIPITKQSMPSHILAARNSLLCYIAETRNTSFVNGKMIFLSGSPELDNIHGILTGRLSGIVNHHVPSYLTKNRLPSYETNCIDDWETKLDAIVQETLRADMRLISGIPPWVQMYFSRLNQRSGLPIGKLFPSFSLMVHGGVNFEPYKTKLFESIGHPIHTIETFPASEGFFAFQDSQSEEGLLLNTKAGMFFEFVTIDEMQKEYPNRIRLQDVQIGIQYALLVSSNAGLWCYNIGDTIRFVSLQPYRIVVTGRIKHFISAFGEHVIAEEVEHAMKLTASKFNTQIIEFTVAPFISSDAGKSYHEWFIAFDQIPSNLEQFATELNHQMCLKNIYYDDLLRGNILATLQIRCLPKTAFIDYMKSIGKLGGQNKVPRLSNHREIANALYPMIL